MKKIFILFLINFVFSASVLQETAVNIAENFYNYKRKGLNRAFIKEEKLFYNYDSIYFVFLSVK